jgi:dipeptidyl aminopeptidase/acylaminoacyl peptidase
MNKLTIIVFVIIALLLGTLFLNAKKNNNSLTPNLLKSTAKEELIDNPLSIEKMKQKDYPGSDLQIEQTLLDGSGYHQYIASYKSNGLKIYGLLTIPTSEKPIDGFPVIIFNHGYIPPAQYRTTERYVSYVDNFAKNGYIVFKSDYRGNGSSEGQPEGAYYSTAYTEDVLNALSSLKKYKDVDPTKIGFWGHSMGGNITLRSLVVRPNDIKVAVIWGGVVGTYEDLAYNWKRSTPFRPSPEEQIIRNRTRAMLMEKYGSPSAKSKFWTSIDPNFYLQDIKAPIQLHTGDEDEEVPAVFSQDLYERLKKINKVVEFYSYPNGDHNISEPNFSVAMQRSLQFFDKYLK